MEIDHYDRYWKFPELAELRLLSPLTCASPETALLTTLDCAWKLASPWILSDPGPDGHREFTGIASANTGARFSVPGIEWMEFFLTDQQ
ncbi:hypothetical protein AB0I00_13550 [Streptomyces sp. NPDC050803]|uniref:hypothetical protein n=1 Tax=unclassified Streptomyces TaxID=2593676 RepID=UPI00343EBDDB